MALQPNYGPYAKMPGSPFFGVGGPGANGGAAGGGSHQGAPNFTIQQKVVFKSSLSANPGVLVSGRRPDRPGR